MLALTGHLLQERTEHIPACTGDSDGGGHSAMTKYQLIVRVTVFGGVAEHVVVGRCELDEQVQETQAFKCELEWVRSTVTAHVRGLPPRCTAEC